MRIANLMFGGKRGGIEQAAVDYARALAAEGHDSRIILRPGAAVLPQCNAAGLPVQLLAAPFPWNPLAHRRLARLVAGCDLLIVHGNRAGELVTQMGCTIPTVAVAHSRFFTPRPEFHALIALSESGREDLRQHAGCPVYTLPNMIDVPAPYARPAWRTPPVVGAMGRIAPIKGFDLLLEATALLRDRGIDIALRIGGDGPARAALAEQAERLGIADRVTWVGWVEDKRAFFDTLDLFCLSSRSETFPITLLEAMAHGLPAIATDCGGPATIVTEGTGLLAPISAEGIAAALAQALADPAAAQRMGIAAQANAAQQYARPAVAAALGRIAAEVVAQPGPILNVMFGKLRGGLEQAAIDYAEAMDHATLPHATVLSPGAQVSEGLAQRRLPVIGIPTAGWWDLLADYRLRRIARMRRARAAICHGNRAFCIARRALAGRIPVIAVAHNDRTEHFPKADACFCISTHARDRLLTAGVPRQRLFMIPNMARLPALDTARPRHQPPVIGTLGRFIPRKGFQDWIAALALLRDRGVDFRAILGGDGEMHTALREQVNRHGLHAHVTFPGWVENNACFYDQLDLFVMPSRHEPFGIVLIEAMAHGVPVISTAVEGPRDIVADGRDALVVPAEDPVAMADAMHRLLADAPLATRLAAAARRRVEQEYSLDAMAGRLKAALADIISPA